MIFTKMWLTLDHESFSEGTRLEAADVGPCKFCQAERIGITSVGAGGVALEPEAHRLRPEGLSLSTTFESIITY